MFQQRHFPERVWAVRSEASQPEPQVLGNEQATLRGVTAEHQERTEGEWGGPTLTLRPTSRIRYSGRTAPPLVSARADDGDPSKVGELGRTNRLGCRGPLAREDIATEAVPFLPYARLHTRLARALMISALA